MELELESEMEFDSITCSDGGGHWPLSQPDLLFRNFYGMFNTNKKKNSISLSSRKKTIFYNFPKVSNRLGQLFFKKSFEAVFVASKSFLCCLFSYQFYLLFLFQAASLYFSLSICSLITFSSFQPRTFSQAFHLLRNLSIGWYKLEKYMTLSCIACND